MAKKTIFHEFDPLLYPIKVWVSVCPHHTQVQRKFYALSEDNEALEFNQSILADDNCTIASTFPVSAKKDYQGGLLVIVYKQKRFTTNYITHEAAHCADFFAERLGLTTGKFHDGEAYAYLIGWIAECIENAVKSSRAAKKKKKK